MNAPPSLPSFRKFPPSFICYVQNRLFFTLRKRLDLVEAEADMPNNRVNARKQAEYYKELYRTGNFAALISRFESQNQLHAIPRSQRTSEVRRLQRDPDSLKYYLLALSRDGQMDKISEKIAELVALSSASPSLASNSSLSPSNPSQYPSSTASQPSPSGYSEREPILGEPRLHYMKTDLNSWDDRTRGRISSQMSSSSSPQYASPDSLEPIPIIITEAWSWSKFIRHFSTRALYGVVAITALSYLLDQQGIMTGGLTHNSEIVAPDSPDKIVMFNDVQGVDEAKQELEEVVQFLKEPDKFRSVGGKLPKGVLLYGPPGTGKTLMARAVAGEAGVPFFYMSGSEFDELFVGTGARRVRELFAAAKKKAPCIVFIDEIDAVGSKRNSKDQSYMRQTLNQLLVELDGFTTAENVIFMAATNTPEALDKALIRPGRFDKLVPVPLPDVKGRVGILAVHCKNVIMDSSIDLSIVARGTPGFSGADLANLVNQGALRASKNGASSIVLADLEWAKDKIIMGAERKSAVITETSKRLTAAHEAGHSLVALFTPGAMPLHKVTIIPRGNALGLTIQLPEADKNNHTKRELLAMIDVCMGGRAAEDLYFGELEITTGALNDLEKATDVARKMVLQYGMTSLGLMNIRDDELERVSTHTRMEIENEIQKLLSDSYTRAKAVLATHRVELDRLSLALCEYETLGISEIQEVIVGRKLSKDVKGI